MAAETKRKIGGGRFLKRCLILGLIIWVVVNPLAAAMAVHNIAHWIGSL